MKILKVDRWALSLKAIISFKTKYNLRYVYILDKLIFIHK